MRSTDWRRFSGSSASNGAQKLVQPIEGVLLAGGRDHQHRHAAPRDFRIEAGDDVQRIGNVGAAPAGSGLGDVEIAAGRGAAPLHLDAGVAHAKQLARLMLGQDAGDVVVDDDHFVDLVAPLLGEHADRRRAAADPHALLELAVDDRRLAGLHDHARAAVDDELDRLAVAEIEQGLAGDAALLLAAVGEVIDAAEREHLRAVFAGRHMADRLALGAHGRAFGAEMAVGVDFELHAAIAVDALGDDRHHVDAIDLGRDDEGRGLVVGIGGAGADGGDEWAGRLEDVAAPGALRIDKRHDLAAFADGRSSSTCGSTRTNWPSWLA